MEDIEQLHKEIEKYSEELDHAKELISYYEKHETEHKEQIEILDNKYQATLNTILNSMKSLTNLITLILIKGE